MEPQQRGTLRASVRERQVRERVMAGTIWTPVLGWVGAIGAALAFAFAAPSERGLLGKFPSFTAKRMHDQAPIALPQQLPSDRTLALVVFKNSQQGEAQGWIDGLKLNQDSPIAWVRIPVFSTATMKRSAAPRRRCCLHAFPASTSAHA